MGRWQKGLAGLCLLAQLVIQSGCARLPPFTALPQGGPAVVAGAPYTGLVSYMGFMVPGQEPDVVEAGRKGYVHYLWLPAEVPELGVRVRSPMDDVVDAGTVWRDPLWEAYRDSPLWFVPALTVARCAETWESLARVGPCSRWYILGQTSMPTTFAETMPSSPADAVVRISSSTTEPAQTLTRGLYRIVITTPTPTEVQGTYVLQVGATVGLDDARISRTLQGLSSASVP